MNRSIWFSICAILGLALLAAGLLLPIHLRAVDAGLLARAGKGSPTLVEEGLGLAGGQGLGAAQLLSQAAVREKLPDANRLELTVNKLSQEHPEWVIWGGADEHLETRFLSSAHTTNRGRALVTEIVIQTENRAAGLRLLRSSPCAAVPELLRCRDLTNTVIFPPSSSASGQAFDASVIICGLLLNELHLTPEMSNSVFHLAAQANHGGPVQPLEQVLLDMLALGQRFNWSQLTVFVGKIQDADTLHRLASEVRQAGDKLPIIFSAVQLSGNPTGVAEYLATFSQTGTKDLGTSLWFGKNGLNELLHCNQRLHISAAQQNYGSRGAVGSFYNFTARYCLSAPGLALAVKWLLYFAGGMFAAGALHFARPAVSFLEEPLQVRGIHFAREILFALGFLLMVVILSEPFLTQDSQKAPPPLRLQLPTAGRAVAAGIASIKTPIMNTDTLSLTTLGVFFVLQGLLYLSCLIKLAEIRRQHVLPGMKLKLLENEDHLFDAGLYLGFAGTIVSLIFASLHVIHFSLMAAYSCTAFGIIFVSIFKIFHLRPTRRQLLLEADALNREPAPTPTPGRIRVGGIPSSIAES